MCYYTGANLKKGTLLKLGDNEIPFPFDPVPLVQGFNFGNYPILRMKDASLTCELAHWEFIPSWTKNIEELRESRKKFTTLNATSEKLLESKMFKEASLKRRCLVISTGFYEWRHFRPDGAKKDESYPYYISLPGQHYFYMAGIWSPWYDKETGETMDTFAIVTTKANKIMSEIHNTKHRMPTILPDALASEWISDNMVPERILELGAYEYDSRKMGAWPIRKEFRASGDPMEKAQYAELPPLQV